MRALRPIALALAAALAGVVHPTHALEARGVFKAADPSIVVVLATNKDAESLGSGVIVEPTAVVTSCHVVEEATKISVVQGSLGGEAVGG